MAELPHLGQHCSEESCKQLDFLPMKCDGCKGIFCKDHIQYRSHNCEVAHTKDVQVPVCPLCDQPIPIARGETPDIRVGAHIDNDCQSDPAIAKRKIYKNKCSLKGCKQKEMIKVLCPNCQLNYCLKHRHPADHKCNLPNNAGSASATQAGAAALARQKTSQHTAPARSRDYPTQKNTPNAASTFQNLSEDEALARALQMSLMDEVPNPETDKLPNSMEDEDAMLSRAIALSEQEYQQQLQRRDARNSKCIVA